MRKGIIVVWCKWSFWCGCYKYHLSRRFKTKEKAKRFANKIDKKQSMFVCEYIVNGEVLEELE